MKKMLDDTQAELDAYIQKTHLLEPLVEEDEILRRDIAQSAAELTQVKLERDLAKDSMSELINEHQQTMESLRKEHEVAMESFQKEHEAAMDSLRKEQEMVMSVLEAQHKENLECVGREATQAQELLMTKHQEEITRLSTTAPQAEDVVTLQLEISSVQTQVNTLQETIEKQAKEITELAMIKAALARDLTEAKAEVTKSEGELKKAKQLAAQAELSTLTPTSPKITSGSFMCKHPECHEQLTTTTTKASTILSRESKDVAARHEFSWAQFIFPLGKKGTAHVNQTPTSMLMSGGFMLVGLGAFVFMRRSGFTVK
ncbi:hypothetical protein BC939DRAFT_298128 [Gamsiella multidivaricata]|uniref:uncharacterized protein n=1 Tax=Gamsiella multidivaricata TaxID=101098 RepID=UPI00221EB31D|nr:uncharacterized protein BC939DRAFT_298128 [Gamsiella multidivaricata]KAI7818203.1 hypothetical protein BC939DRAFT_298128 [Gamsiella multidivaricata]